MYHESSILIVGSGTFGISTAYHLAQRGYKNITCIDRRPCPSVDSAGYDLNKIIRTEYDEPLYSEMALEAIQAWRDPLFEGIFHETGWIVATCGDPKAVEHIRHSYENLREKHGADGIEFIEKAEDILRHVPQLRHAKGLKSWKGLWNRQAGWAHAAKALERLAGKAKQLGVKFISGDEGTMLGVESSNGRMAGIKVASGRTLSAEKYIICTGANSPALFPELSPQLWSKCFPCAHIELTEDEMAEFRNMPIVDNHEFGFFFEPEPDTRLLKICNNSPGYQYRAGVYDGHNYSVPRYLSEHPGEGVPQEALEEIRRFIDAILPQFSNRPLLGARYCWCTDTPDQHFLIGPHPNYQEGELLLATGDSGHAFKFFPTIGGYIADCLEGKGRGVKKEWQWSDRKWKTVPTRPDEEIKDLRDVKLGGGGSTGSRSTAKL